MQIIFEDEKNGAWECEIPTPIRIDKIIAMLNPNESRATAQEWIKSGLINVNGVCKRSPAEKIKGLVDIRLNVAQKDSVPTPNHTYDFARSAFQNDDSEVDANFELVYEDEHLLVVNKPAGVVVHPGAGNHSNTLAHSIYRRYHGSLSTMGGNDRPGIIHRLDKDTSGLMLVARSDNVHRKLAAAFASPANAIKEIQNEIQNSTFSEIKDYLLGLKNIERSYLALVLGNVFPKAGIINKPIARHRTNRKKFAIRDDGRTAITFYNQKKYWQLGKVGISLLNCQLATGRTHQIRVHLANSNNYVLGDKLYSPGSINLASQYEEIVHLKDLQRQALHAWKLKFIHPISNEEMQFTAPIPNDIQSLINNFDTAISDY